MWDVVAAQARRQPSAEAVRGERRCTYAELVDAAEAVARDIGALTGPGRFVALDGLSPASAAVAFLAAGRSGCAVLPLNAESPQRLRQFVLADSRPAVVLREPPGAPAPVPAPVAASAGDPPDGASDPADVTGVAYTLYTSGSTGRPKGVMVPHAELIARLAGLAELPGAGPGDTILAMTAITFDISLAEFLLPLVVGGCLVEAPPGARSDPAIFARVVAETAPSIVQATPSFWRLALAWGWSGPVRGRVWCGGEALTPDLATRLLPVVDQLWNVYGPTEATIWATANLVTTADAVSLGRPIPGSEMFLEDEDGRAVTAPGEPGEIVLTGAGLARGYLNQPELTERAFVMRDRGGERRRCYRTGDLAWWHTDGTLHFAGRADGQVKIRGHRVELGELEAAVERHPAVYETAAVLRADDGPDSAQIVMYVVTDGTVSVRELRAWLAEWIAPPARPGRIVLTTTLPRTTSGKVDRNGLAALPPR